MKKTLPVVTFCFSLLAPSLYAEERYNHFPALDAPDLPTAVCHLSRYNKKLTNIVNADDISVEDLVKVHELTYTLENALMKVQESLQVAAADLESVHLASESIDYNTVKLSGLTYLKALEHLMNSNACE